MNNALSFDKILDLPNEMLRTAEKYNDYAELLRKKVYQEYDSKTLKDDIMKKIDKYKDTKYLYNYSVESLIKITPKYELKESTTSNTSSSVVENIVTRSVDQHLWIECFYETMLVVAAKLTTQEAIYLVDSFFGNKSEDFIAEKLMVCKMTLQNIKKSCLVKTWIELKTLD